MDTKLILIRHAQSATNGNKMFTGQLDAGLSELGLRQAALVARFVASRYRPDRIYTSDLKRAVDTAAAVSSAAGVPFVKSRGLREILVPEWEGRAYSDLAEAYPQEWAAFFDDPEAFLGVGASAESVRDMACRVEAELRSICSGGGCVAVVTHGTPIRAMQALWGRGGLGAMRHTSWAGNASVTVAGYDGTSFHLLESSLSEHLGPLCSTIAP